MDELAEFKQTYFQECDELLADLEGQLTSLQDGHADNEVLHAAFRAIHSIKGGAGAFSFHRLVAFAHVFETVLDRMREHQLDISGPNIALLIRAGDALADLIAAARAGAELAADFGQDVLTALHELAGTEAGDDALGSLDELDELEFTPVRAALAEPQLAAAPEATERTVRISLAPLDRMYQRANDPLLLLRELKALGTLRVAVSRDRLPPLAAMTPGGAYLEWQLTLTTNAPPKAVEDVFEFVIGDSEITIDDLAEPAPLALATDADVEQRDPVAGGAPAAPEPTPDAPMVALDPDRRAAAPARATSSAAPDAATPASARVPEAKAPATIRVDLERIDRLVNMVGELVITQAMISEQAGRLAVDRHVALLHGVETLALQMRELQESVMAIRAQPVKSVFARMTRLVRELSAALGKEARLVITGEHTEVDKTVIEELADPLTHMIRNAMDHGLESPQERQAAGKLAEGVIRLSAEHRSGRIVISVSDDGRGIRRDKVLQKAIGKGLIAADARPSDDEIDNLILLPGFSTADQVSDVSGRGVGMDVVVRKIQNMGGRIAISSIPGKSSRFTLTLPLTLAVLDGMVVRVGAENYILPITSIVESLRPSASDIHSLACGGEVLSIRGDYIRLASLSRLFATPGAVGHASEGLIVIVETGASGRIGLVVDELVGQQQVVIKSLEANYRRVEGVAGATILGNGMVAMILDVDGLRTMSHHAPAPPTARMRHEATPCLA